MESCFVCLFVLALLCFVFLFFFALLIVFLVFCFDCFLLCFFKTDFSFVIQMYF